MRITASHKKNIMKGKILSIIAISALFTFHLYGQKEISDAHLFGHVVCEDCNDHLSFATITIQGTTIGTSTDETGHYRLINLPPGTYLVRAAYIGYQPQTKAVTINSNETTELDFVLRRDALGIEEVVITGDRNETNRKEAAVIVNTISPRMLRSAQAVTLGEGLNFTPGLRMENNCQNCGFSQVRMNGMEGPYAQVLINSRPIFSGLAGVYGLELIPSNMVERVEVIRGGGSALYGSNAIAGTINLILKDPVNNSYEAGFTGGMIGAGTGPSSGSAGDYTLQLNTSLVSSDSRTGMALYGFYRDRDPYDANGDEFSEISQLQNNTIGTRLFHRFSNRSKVAADFFNIREERRGGDRFDYPLHETNIAEAVTHNITTGAITYDRFFRSMDKLSVYISGQRINRDSYYGALQSLRDYGNTRDFTYTLGTQYNVSMGKSELILGLENDGSWLKDMKLGYPDLGNIVVSGDSVAGVIHTENVLVADQSKSTTGVFGQYEAELDRWKFTAGARYDNYRVLDGENPGGEQTGNVISPRITVKYDITPILQSRLSFSKGYRAPQIFDEDLHIETSGSRQVLHRNSPDLRQETSYSVMGSLDMNRQLGKAYLGLLLEGFHTILQDPFANHYSDPDENGTVIYTRVNAEGGARVSGVNLEMNLVPSETFSVKTGFTVQASRYEEPQEFDEKRFFRTPGDYGYFIIDWKSAGKFGATATGNYTGRMLVPYFGPLAADPDEGELRESGRFMDVGLRLHYSTKLNGATLQITGGMKNILNSYQDDFDSGINRDPGYIYGPMAPRSIYIGLNVGNFLK